MKAFTLHKSAAVATALLVIMVAAVASGDSSHDGYEIDDVKVDYSDLDLSGRSGLITLYRRVQDAALKSCGQLRLLPLYDQPDSGNCYIDTFNATLVAIGSKPLERIHDELQIAPVFVYLVK